MSALPPKADIRDRDWHVRFVPKADIGKKGWDIRSAGTDRSVLLVAVLLLSHGGRSADKFRENRDGRLVGTTEPNRRFTDFTNARQARAQRRALA
jgi:hypothetical protein